MPFQIGGRHDRGGIQEFVNGTDGPAFLERELVELGVMGTGRSEFLTMQVHQCPFTHFESI